MRKVFYVGRTVVAGSAGIKINEIHFAGEQLVVKARGIQETAICPECGEPSNRIHS